MFTKVTAVNFKSFRNLKIDFTAKKNEPKKLALIYGENGSGKSNISSIFHFLMDTLATMRLKDQMEEILSVTEKLKDLDNKILKAMQKDRFIFLDQLVDSAKTIGTKENLKLSFEFLIEKKLAYYEMEFNSQEIISEKLKYIISERTKSYFEISNDNVKLSKSIFKSESYRDELESKIEKFWGKHTFLSILFYEIEDKNQSFLINNLDTKLFILIKFLMQISCRTFTGIGRRGTFNIYNPILAHLDAGQISLEKEEELDKIESITSEIFSSLYADIKVMYYKRKRENDKINYELYCKKMIGGELVDIPFELESSGTQLILSLIPPMILALKGQTVIIDEFDTGIHDLLVSKLLSDLKEALKGQLILTTHNTLLMESDEIENEDLYFITVNDIGDKEVLCLTDYVNKPHPFNNRRTQYLKGMYAGIPVVRSIDFEKIIEDLID